MAISPRLATSTLENMRDTLVGAGARAAGRSRGETAGRADGYGGRDPVRREVAA